MTVSGTTDRPSDYPGAGGEPVDDKEVLLLGSGDVNSDFFFDNQDNIYVVHQGKVDRINMPGGQRRTIVDLDAMGGRKEKSGLEITGYL